MSELKYPWYYHKAILSLMLLGTTAMLYTCVYLSFRLFPKWPFLMFSLISVYFIYQTIIGVRLLLNKFPLSIRLDYDNLKAVYFSGRIEVIPLLSINKITINSGKYHIEIFYENSKSIVLSNDISNQKTFLELVKTVNPSCHIIERKTNE